MWFAICTLTCAGYLVTSQEIAAMVFAGTVRPPQHATGLQGCAQREAGFMNTVLSGVVVE